MTGSEILTKIWLLLSENWYLLLIGSLLGVLSDARKKDKSFLDLDLGNVVRLVVAIVKDIAKVLFLGSALRFIFFIVSDAELEGKARFRLLKVVNIALYALIILATIFVGWFGSDSRSNLAQATVLCGDGTTWNAIDRDGYLLDNYYLCGLCTKMGKSGSYTPCSYSDYDSSSFRIIDKQYKAGVFVRPLVFLVTALTLLKLVLKAVIYVATGKK